MNDPIDSESSALSRNERYRHAAARHGPAIARLARASEADPVERADLEQEIHVQLWRSLGAFDGRCSLRTWVFRVAHNVAASHARARAGRSRLQPEEPETADAAPGPEEEAARAIALERLHAFIRRLDAADRQIALLYLEDMEAREIAEITGLSPGAVATRISRIKTRLAEQFAETRP